MAEKELRGFEDLDCYKLALTVLDESYRASRLLPPEEKYNLVDQIRRAAVSVTLNIAEGYGRYHYLDSLRFYYIARGSLEETLGAFIVCDKLGYIPGELSKQRLICGNAIRSLNGYIRYVRAQQQGHQEYGNHAIHENYPPYSMDVNPSLDS
jgi:four helix bundle protein